jgi:hypothetical protein
MKMGEEASKHKVTTDKQRNWSLIITSTSVWEADAASCHAVDSIAKCHNSEYESGANCMCVCLVLHCHNLQLPLCARCSVRLPSLTILGPVVYCFLYCDAMQPVTLQMGTTGFRMLILIYHVLTRCHSCVSAMYLTWWHSPQDSEFHSHLCGNLHSLVLYLHSCLEGHGLWSEPSEAILTEIFHSFIQSHLFILGKNCFGQKT